MKFTTTSNIAGNELDQPRQTKKNGKNLHSSKKLLPHEWSFPCNLTMRSKYPTRLRPPKVFLHFEQQTLYIFQSLFQKTIVQKTTANWFLGRKLRDNWETTDRWRSPYPYCFCEYIAIPVHGLVGSCCKILRARVSKVCTNTMSKK